MKIHDLINKVVNELGFTIIEYNNLKALIKPKKYDLPITITFFYNFTKEEIEEIESSENGYEMIKKETIRLIYRNFDPVYHYKNFFDNKTNDYMKDNGYFFALELNKLDEYISNLFDKNILTKDVPKIATKLGQQIGGNNEID